MSGPQRLSTTRIVSVAAATQGVAMLPMFLTGALAVQMSAELDYGPSALGVATGGFILARAIASIPAGLLVDRLGSIRSMRLSAMGSGLASLSVAVLAREWWTLAVILFLAGVVQATSQPAANRFVVRSIDQNRMGIAFGLKQSGPPAAVMLAGLTVPVLALTLGWRSAFVLASLLSLATLFAVPSRTLASAPPTGPTSIPLVREHAPSAAERGAQALPDGRASGGLGLVMIGMAFTLAAVNSTQTFIVGAAVDSGISPGVAGSILAVGGVLAIVSRIISGLYVDRKQVGYLTYVAKILAVGSVGYLFLAIGLPPSYFLGTVLAYGATWGVNGVLFMAVVRHRPERPAAVSGQVIAVGSIGGFVGPPIYGLVAENFGYRPAWMMAAAWVAIAATSIFMSGAARSEARLDGDSVADGASDAPAG